MAVEWEQYEDEVLEGMLKDQLRTFHAKHDETNTATMTHQSRKRPREQQQEKKYAQESLARDLLQPIDNLERAIQAFASKDPDGPLVQGVKLVLHQLFETLKRHGVKPVEALHKPFDANFHQAVNQVSTDAFPAMTVVQVHQSGYLLHDRVLRPASVGVSTGTVAEAAE